MNPNPHRSFGLSRRALRACSGLVCALGLWGAAAVAHGAPGRPTLAELPIASLPRLDSLKTPEQVEITSEDLPFEVVFPTDRPVQKKGKAAAVSYTYVHWLTLRARAKEVCLSAGGAAGTRTEDRDHIEMYGYSHNDNQIFSVRAERLSLDQGPALVVDDFFVAPTSGKVERGATTRVPLLKVAEGPDRLTVYAFREHNQVHLVFAAPGATMIGPTARPVVLGCGLSRVSLDTSGRSGVATSFAVGLPESVQPERLEQFHGYDQVPMQRAVRVSVSVSQTSRDPAPILSLTFGDPSPPVQNALKNQMPRWTDVLGAERAREIEAQVAKRQ